MSLASYSSGIKKIGIIAAFVALGFALAGTGCSAKEQSVTSDAKADTEITETSSTPTPTNTPTPSPTPTPIPILIKTIQYEVIGADRVKIDESDYEDGNKVKSVSYYANSTSEWFGVYEDGVMIASNLHITYPDGSLDNQYEWKYTKDGIIEYERIYSLTTYCESVEELSPVYDDSGLLIGLEGTNSDDYGNGPEIRKETIDYTYDADGRVVKEVKKIGSSEYITTNVYDEQGRLVYKSYSGGLDYSYSYTLSEDGRIITEVYNHEEYTGIYSPHESHTDTTKNIYNEDGLLISSTTEYQCASAGKSYAAQTTYEYDDCGNLTKTTTETQKNGFAETIVYEYENVYQ